MTGGRGRGVAKSPIGSPNRCDTSIGGVLRGCLTANLARVFSHHLFDAEKQGSEIEGIFQMPADVVGIGGAKNTTHIF